MKTLKNGFAQSFKGVLIAALVGTVGTAQAIQGPKALGNLIGHNQVSVVSGGARVAVSASPYAYFAGDRVSTAADSAAALRLDDGGAVYAGPESEVRVSREAGQYVVAVEKGGVRFSFTDGTDFQVLAAGKIIEPEAYRQASDSSARRIGGVVVIQDGEPLVHVTDGSLVVRDTGTGRYQAIKVGESVTFDAASGSFVKVLNPGGGENEGGRRILFWLLGIGFTAWAIDQLNNNSDGPAASPAQ
jgi:ferric-dicitrate binding protein FerR (iron transport regulator)